MRYLFLLYGDPDGEAALTPEERRAVVAGHTALGRELVAAGRLHAAQALGADVHVLRADGTVTDGPYAETKEQLGSVHLVDCADAAEALALARRMPASPGLVVEIRAVLEV
ncbi:MAG: YciI family protein [Mycobacteriales bacterium]